MRPQRRPAPRAIPVVDRSGHRVTRPRATDAPGVAPSRRMPAVNGTAADAQAKEAAVFRSLTRQQQIEAAITACVVHLRKQNSDDELRALAGNEVYRFALDESLRKAQLIDDGSDPRIVLRGASVRELRTAWAALRHLAPQSTAVVTQPRMPNRDPWWTFIRDLRLRTGDAS